MFILTPHLSVTCELSVWSIGHSDLVNTSLHYTSFYKYFTFFEEQRVYTGTQYTCNIVKLAGACLS